MESSDSPTPQNASHSAVERLTSSEYVSIFNHIRQDLFDGIVSQAHPIAILLAGQPGSGKSVLARAKSKLLDGEGGSVILDADELRSYHPRYRQYAKEDYNTAAQRIQPDISQLISDLRKEAIKCRMNIIIDGTLADVDNAKRLIRDLKQGGYQTEIHALATPKAQSELGIAARVENALADPTQRAIPRSVPEEYHSKAFDKVATTLAAIERQPDPSRRVDRIAVYLRGNTTPIYDSQTSQDQKATETLISVRNQALTPQHKTNILTGWTTVLAQAQQRNAPQSILDQYRSKAEKIGISDGPDPQSPQSTIPAGSLPQKRSGSEKLTSALGPPLRDGKIYKKLVGTASRTVQMGKTTTNMAYRVKKGPQPGKP